MWNIQLRAAAFNTWLDDMEQKLTSAGDMLDMMEVETEQLKIIWESTAGELWKAEFQSRISEARASLSEMNKIILTVGEMGKELADMEGKMIAAAEKL